MLKSKANAKVPKIAVPPMNNWGYCNFFWTFGISLKRFEDYSKSVKFYSIKEYVKHLIEKKTLVL